MHITDMNIFNKEWLKIFKSIKFLLRWSRIVDDPSIERLLNYLRMFDSYVEPHVQVSDLSILEFSLPNFNKSSREEIIV